MRRYRFFVKGSVQELKWLNRQAKKGWLLTAVQGWRYTFKAVTKDYQLFTEYVPMAVPTDAQTGKVFQLLTVVSLPSLAVKVLYSASVQASLTTTPLKLTTDEKVELKVALGTRSRLQSVANWWTVGVVVLITGLLAAFKGEGPGWLFGIIVGTWFVVCIGLYWQILHIHRSTRQLRARLQDYSGAWRPTMHVFVTNLSAPLDVDRVASLGAWRLVGHSKSGAYWYDLQTTATQAEIKQTIQPLVSAQAHINVMSYLGLWPL